MGMRVPSPSKWAGRRSSRPHFLCILTTSELIEQPIDAAGQSLTFTGVSVGNPHCVIFKPVGQSWSREDLLKLGPALENHSLFPKRINVQLAVATGPRELFILIWERGAGETQASGSSSCAAASAAVRLGLVKSPVTVKMPGGSLHIEVAADFSLTMKGPVAEVARGLSVLPLSGRCAERAISRLRSAFGIIPEPELPLGVSGLTIMSCEHSSLLTLKANRLWLLLQNSNPNSTTCLISQASICSGTSRVNCSTSERPQSYLTACGLTFKKVPTTPSNT